VNNIATSVAEQPPPPKPPRNFPSQAEQSRLWAEKAVAVAGRVAAADRTDECATGCAAAKANVAELLERAGRLQEAQRLFGEAGQLAASVGFAAGVEKAAAGRARVQLELRKRHGG
jgi:hypothetical protein